MEIIHAVGGRVPRTLSYEPAGPKHPTDKAKAPRFTRILYTTLLNLRVCRLYFIYCNVIIRRIIFLLRGKIIKYVKLLK